MTENLTLDALEQRTADSMPLIIDFYADWCGSCKMLAPIFARVAAAYEGQVEFAKVDADAQAELAARFDVETLPVVVALKGTEVVHNASGILSEPKLKALADSLL